MIVAIDGASGSGKSTLAKLLAERLNFTYLDTGAMYRAITFEILRQGVLLEDMQNLELLLDKAVIEFRKEDDIKKIFINDRDVTQEIRTQRVANMVSQVAKIKIVRQKLVAMQQQIGRQGNTILDGRDIGTVVFPEADIKFFLTADVETRAGRRLQETKESHVSLAQVKQNIEQRDKIDSTRQESPLRKADDAILLDNTNLTIEQTLEIAFKHIQRIL